MTNPSQIDVSTLREGETKAADVAERNLQAECVWRGKRLMEVRDALTCINDELEDEGDRVYFASTNHADRFRETVEMLEEFGWSLIIKDKSKPDYIADLAKARGANRANQELIKELVEALKPFAEAAASYDPAEDDDAFEAWEETFPIGALRTARAAIAKAGA